MKKLLLLAMLLSLSTPAWAQRVNQLSAVAPSGDTGTGIAAVVNDGVITTTDLEQRLRLAILSSGLPDNAEVRAHFLPQILRSLIDEQLQTQEAKRLDLSVSQDEINQALEHIAHDNNIPGDMLQFVASHGASPAAMTAQVKDGLLWNKVVQRELRPKVEIGDDEIDAVIDRVRADAGKEEYLVSEILLTVDNPKDEDQVKQTAENLVDQVKHGANFASLARQFSQGVGAAQGGDIGWIQQGQLAPEINRALANAGNGQVSDPIRTASGFHILGVRDRRTVSLGDPSKTTLNLVQIFRPRTAGVPAATIPPDAVRLRATIKSCDGINAALSSFPEWKAQKLGNVNLAKAPNWLADKVRNVSAGSSSEPLATDKGTALLVVCNRHDGGEIDRDAIMHSIGTEKLELQARRLLRDLRRAAYLDIRLGNNS
jgi:peptidyl-prolyl cis-trans isomerase SurA